MDVQEHQWKFFRAGGVDQVWFRNGNDIAHLETLDQQLWLALACPAHGPEFDSQTLALLDIDHDGRIRAPEILAACKWLKEALRNLDDLYKGGAEVPLSSINDQTAIGAALLSGARRILAEYKLAKDDILGCRDFDDTIGVNGWPVEAHVAGDVNFLFAEWGSRGFNQIPYRIIVPRKIENLFVAGRCASMTHEGQSSARVTGSCFVMGQAAGTAADLALGTGATPRTLDVGRLQARLEAEGAYLGRDRR